MAYTVTVYENKNLPYTISDIDATNEAEAVLYAKKFVATNGYWPGLNINKVISMLKVESIKET